ncbi:MAG: hypothetical protein AB2A00_03030 [Myxococcota bacterium]
MKAITPGFLVALVLAGCGGGTRDSRGSSGSTSTYNGNAGNASSSGDVGGSTGGSSGGASSSGGSTSGGGASSAASSSGNVAGSSSSGSGQWHCTPSYQGGGDGCDCGCGAPDPDCGGAGCSEPGCFQAACQYCYDAQGGNVTCPAPSSSSSGGAFSSSSASSSSGSPLPPRATLTTESRSWTIESVPMEVDTDPNQWLEAQDMALDSAEQPRVIYQMREGGNPYVRFVFRSSQGWTHVPLNVYSEYFATIQIALDSQDTVFFWNSGNAHLPYINVLDGETVYTEYVGQQGHDAYDHDHLVQLAVDGSNNIHAIYYNPTDITEANGSHYYYAVRGPWSGPTEGASAQMALWTGGWFDDGVNLFLRLAVSRYGDVRVVGETNRTLQHAVLSGTSVTWEPVQVAGQSGPEPWDYIDALDVKVDSQGRTHLLWVHDAVDANDPTARELRYAVRLGGGWTMTRLDGPVFAARLELDGQDRPNILYEHCPPSGCADVRETRVLRQVSGSWRYSVPDTQMRGYDATLRVTSSGAAHIFYEAWDGVQRRYRYAYAP